MSLLGEAVKVASDASRGSVKMEHGINASGAASGGIDVMTIVCIIVVAVIIALAIFGGKTLLNQFVASRFKK